MCRVYLLKRSLQWYYVWTIDLKEEKLRFLRSEKKKILERVMETETYKVAKELLEKYDPSALKERPSVTSASPDTNLRSTRLRYRGSMPPLPPNLNFQSPSLQARPSTSLIRPDRMSTPRAIMPSPQSTANMRMSTPPPPRLSRPIVSQDRGVVEKLVDYIVGDGPSNRYALICSNCHGHNGMALADEFEFMSFRCCYCGYFNSARKQKAFAPPLLTLASTSNTTSNTTNLTTRGERGLSPVIDEPESDNENKENSGDSFKITEIEEVSSTGQPSSASSEAVTQGENASVSDTIDKENENSLPKVEENGDKAINTENNAEPSEPLSSAKSDLDEKAFGTDFDFVDEVTPDNA